MKTIPVKLQEAAIHHDIQVALSQWLVVMKVNVGIKIDNLNLGGVRRYCRGSV